MKKGDKVIWRVTSGFCTMAWVGTIMAKRRNEFYVLFAGGGHWLSESELEIAND